MSQVGVINVHLITVMHVNTQWSETDILIKSYAHLVSLTTGYACFTVYLPDNINFTSLRKIYELFQNEYQLSCLFCVADNGNIERMTVKSVSWMTNS